MSQQTRIRLSASAIGLFAVAIYFISLWIRWP
jgi:hypothetical protein